MVARIGISILGFDDHRTENALKYLLLYTNTLQQSFEFELTRCDPNDVFVRNLLGKTPVDLSMASTLRPQMREFVNRHRIYIAGHEEPPPEHFVLICTASEASNYYARRETPLSVLMLGRWDRDLSPPSVVEFILTILLREAAAVVSPLQSVSVHNGTKGCVFDFTPLLVDARFKSLSSFVCQFCRQRLAADGQAAVADDLTAVLGKTWLGKSSEPWTPAGIVANLGYDLFLSKGLKPTPREIVVSTLRQEGVKAILTLGAGAVLAVLLFLIGVKP